jgi:hypothetical protein
LENINLAQINEHAGPNQRGAKDGWQTGYNADPILRHAVQNAKAVQDPTWFGCPPHVH